ncbi:MAG: 5-formyltetrahydrofolate cyclo-ligase, partial [Kiritimatiellaceae bacterium]|nr:5-formyltetrahydrofolate cyclo-ligase [Kiritimatiellaceae bacterium]
GIKEPISPTLVPLDEIDLIAVPGVAFDLTRNRLGRGGGYYDRILEDFGGTSVAVAFGFQILEEIPVDPHDEPVDILITEIKVDEA